MKRKDSPEAKKKTDLDRPVSVKQLAEHMGVTPRFIRNDIAAGRLKARHFSSRMIRLMPEDVREWIDNAATIAE